MYPHVFQIEPLFCHWIRTNISNYEECVVMSPHEIGVNRVIMIADDLDVDYAVINSRRKHKGVKHLEKRHARLNHQHLSDNWHLVEIQDDDRQSNNSEDLDGVEDINHQTEDDDAFQNVEDILRNLPSEQGIKFLKYAKGLGWNTYWL